MTQPKQMSFSITPCKKCGLAHAYFYEGEECVFAVGFDADSLRTVVDEAIAAISALERMDTPAGPSTEDRVH